MRHIRAHFVLAIAIVSLAVTGIAAAVLYAYDQGGNGTAAGGSFGQQTIHQYAIAYGTGTGTDTPVIPCAAGTGATCTGGTPGTLSVSLTNNDPSNPHAAISPVVTISGAGSCNSHLFVTGSSNLAETVPGGATEQNGTITYVADPSTPTVCDGTAVSASITASSNT